LRTKIRGDTIFAFNTHFDHIGKMARYNSVGLILERIKQIASNHAIVLTGDFNSPTTEAAYSRIVSDKTILLKDTRDTDQPAMLSNEITFMGFDEQPQNDALIDFIFTNNYFKSLTYEVKKINDRNFYFSDHLPVMSEIQLLK